MHSLPREILRGLVQQHGPSLSRDARRCESFLRDLCPPHRREINVLVAAVRARVGTTLLQAPPAMPRAALLARAANRLREEYAIEEEAAAWAAETWAIALGVLEAPDSSSVEQPRAGLAEFTEPPAERLGSSAGRQIRTNDRDTALMLWIPAGEFVMGDADQKDNPRRVVTLDGFWLYKTPVTVKQYREFCAAAARLMPDAPSWGWRDDHPVVNVSWQDAEAYAKWAGASLPTEAQWEKAARGVDSRLYPWGSAWEAGRCAHSVGSARTSTAPSGSFPAGASPYGALDLAGNVWEWCADWYDETYGRTAPPHNPGGAEIGDRRVLRGGSWNDTLPFIFRTAMRFRYDPLGRFISFGFRCMVEEAVGR